MVSPYPTHAGEAAMPECGWLRKREYSNLRDRERVLVILEWEHLSLVCVRDRERVLISKIEEYHYRLTFNAMKQKAY